MQILRAILFLFVCFWAGAANAQKNGLDERSLVERVQNWHLTSISPNALKNKIANDNARIIDLDIVSTSPLRFSVTLVKNTGAHKSAGWWWLYNTSPDAINELVDEKNARVVDIETYKVNGERKFAAVFVLNKGKRETGWYWYFNQSAESLKAKYDNLDQRLIDIERYTEGGATKYAAVMVDNTGDREVGWYWYRNQSAGQLKRKISNHRMRLIDIESYDTQNGVRHAVIMKEFDNNQQQLYWYYHGISGKDLTNMTRRHGARILDIERFGSSTDKYSAVLLNNGIARRGDCDGRLEHFSDALVEKMKEQSIPGGQIAIVKGNRLVYSCGLGLANINTLEKVTPDHMFRTASISKLLTMSAIRDLVAKDKLEYTDTMLNALDSRAPDGQLGDRRIPLINVQQLLDHRAGWSRHEYNPMFEQRSIAAEIGAETPLTCRQIMNYVLTKRSLDFRPGARPSERFDPYSNLGYCILGQIIVEASGGGYARYVKNKILKPAGVTQMRLGNSRLAEAYPEEVRYYGKPFSTKVSSLFPQDSSDVPNAYGGFVLEAMSSHGGWIASANDLVRYAAFTPVIPRPYGGSATNHNGSLSGSWTVLREQGDVRVAILLNGSPLDRDKIRLEPLVDAEINKVTQWPTRNLWSKYGYPQN